MANADDIEKARSSDDMVFVSENTTRNRIAALVLFAIGLLGIVLALTGDDTVPLLLLGVFVLGFGAAVLLAIRGGYPRLHLSGNLIWLETRWQAAKPVDLSDLGPAHVVEHRVSRSRVISLGFLRREEEQALIDTGKPVPNEIDAYHAKILLSAVIPYDLKRAHDIADVVNARRPRFAPTLTADQSSELVGAISRRYWLQILGLFAFAAAVFFFTLVIKNIS